MSDATGKARSRHPALRVRLDDRGRMIPPTEEERRIRRELALRALEEIRAIENEPGEDDAEFFRSFDSHRPHRPLFEGLY